MEIGSQGAISFARFMELALYCPDSGFYERESDTVGRHGHFQTSVSVGNLFGRLLAFQFIKWLEDFQVQSFKYQVKPGIVLQIIEAGAHDGKLAADILGWIQSRQPDQFTSLQYFIIEPSARRRTWQKQTLASFGDTVRWYDSPNDKTLASQDDECFRIIFSNELLDAMPVRRLGWDAKRRAWFEWGVKSIGDDLAWTSLELSDDVSHTTHHAPRELTDMLPEGFTLEFSPAAEAWWRDTAALLKHGKLVTLDYGLTQEEFFSPQRASGTVRSYHQHRHTDNILAIPGEQDITAHVNFTTIKQVGELAGLRTETFNSQSKFLTTIAAQSWQNARTFGGWTPTMTRQFQTLTHPDHLGRAFKALVQNRAGTSAH